MRRFADDQGSAALEFVVAGTLLLVPLVYLVIIISQVEAASFAAEGAVRQATRVFVTAPNLATAQARAKSAMSDALADVHLAPEDANLRISCSPKPSSCLASGGWVTSRITVRVALPLIPKIFHLSKYARVALTAEASEVVPR